MIQQSPLSIADQIRKCKDFASSQGWEFLEDHTYRDEAISGATDDRAGLAALLHAATGNQRPFDVVLVDDTSRLSRKIVDSLRIFEQFKFAGIRVVYVSQGIDADSEQAELLLATHGIVDSLYIRELAKKVHRGVEGLAIRGLHTGGRCFGYRSVPVEDSTKTDTYGRPVIMGVRLEIDEQQAATVRRIFTDYAAGNSIKKIAKRFNAEGVVSPSPYRGQRHPSWAPSAISVMLHNERYKGTVVWNRTRKVRDPLTGRRIQRLRPQSEWNIQEAPHLRIVSEELWQAVQRRLSSIKTVFASGGAPGLCTRAYSAPYLLSGFLKCGLCGSKMVVVSGRGNSGLARYGCPLWHARGICSNRLHIRQDHLEREVLGGLQREVLCEDAVRYAIAKFRAELVDRLENARSHLAVLREEKERLKTEIGNLASVIAAGRYSPALLAELEKRERRIGEIGDELLATDDRGIDAHFKEIETFVLNGLGDVQGRLTGEIPRAKAELGKHCVEITLTPEEGSYRLSGEWDLLRDVRSDGAGGQNRTGYARLFRAALYH